MSVWHWLILILVFAPFAGIIYVAVSRAKLEKMQGLGITAGLKGWLFIFAASLWIGVLKALGEIAKFLENRDPQISAQFPLLDHIDLMALIVQLSLIGLCIFGLMRGKIYFKKCWVALVGFVVVSPFLTSALAVLALSLKYGVSVGFGAVLDEIPGEAWGSWFGALVGLGVWSIYVFRSRRVAVTCVA
ncbi:hypothetical protein [Sediminicoccus rosea]|uniref:Uncharacterized protein n=1 Tax=Sediminicoccus rosea TaxID=1225128 RepID=A0ABZ0PLI4_9PROT|nr:hypothetical protein [Sediminicoccus rosea]WPB86420.1 hypothetical protein R9Z33_05980 [Sediminicoccus rosea]